MPKKPIQPFQFKQFSIQHDKCSMKVGTDGVLLGAWANMIDSETIIDIGTGTGLIAIMTAQRNEKAKITALEIDEAAALQATENAINSPWKNRIEIRHISLQDFIKKNDLKFDHIISNPPFFQADNLSKSKQRDRARNTDSLGQEELIQAVSKLIKPKGIFSLILPEKEGNEFIIKMQNSSFHLNRLTEVKAKKEKKTERLLMEFSNIKKECFQNKLVIQHEKRNDWTEEYIHLTRDFYLKI